ncbi:hypothetical protein K490DRAFT_57318 [Saccharata proteae CBS 121410]|uniref:Uncharacterized protein n=1 Tax=Saccharata proteae CBS 121410 TaxID=1314787 RepID=A0A9P4HU84_9PEZI|nr:hypothetical protein K490DRAFT_57318 [Saccharata proteae CBS 121410]
MGRISHSSVGYRRALASETHGGGGGVDGLDNAHSHSHSHSSPPHKTANAQQATPSTIPTIQYPEPASEVLTCASSAPAAGRSRKSRNGVEEELGWVLDWLLVNVRFSVFSDNVKLEA